MSKSLFRFGRPGCVLLLLCLFGVTVHADTGEAAARMEDAVQAQAARVAALEKLAEDDAATAVKKAREERKLAASLRDARAGRVREAEKTLLRLRQKMQDALDDARRYEEAARQPGRDPMQVDYDLQQAKVVRESAQATAARIKQAESELAEQKARLEAAQAVLDRLDAIIAAYRGLTLVGLWQHSSGWTLEIRAEEDGGVVCRTQRGIWQGRFLDEEKRRAECTYKPEPRELNPAAPEWARTLVADKAIWRMDIRRFGPSTQPRVAVAWYPGEIEWAELLREAWFTEGEGVTIDYRLDLAADQP